MERRYGGLRAWGLLNIVWLSATSCADDARDGSVHKPQQTQFESDQFLRPELARELGISGTNSQLPNPGGGGISDPNLVALAGDRLFVLSQLGNLTVLDVSDPDQLRVIGRYLEHPGLPFVVHVRGNTLWVLYSHWRGVEPGQSNRGVSHVVALDVSDPAAIRQLVDLELPGVVDDARLVGDVMYVVSNEYPGCIRCEVPAPTTIVSAFDVRDPETARQLSQIRFGDRPEQWTRQNSVLLTDRRIYVAGPQWSDRGAIGSTIHVVDISRGAGVLVPGAQVSAAGVISSRLQMDEYDGVLRVLTEADNGSSTAARLQLFKVESSEQITALAELSLPFSGHGQLHGVRFDGGRAFVASRDDSKLYALDLADAAHPQQLAAIDVSSNFEYFEARGDRLIALGTQDRTQTLALFDVARLSAPKLLSEVGYPGQELAVRFNLRSDWSLEILPEAGLIVVPFRAYDFGKDNQCNWSRCWRCTADHVRRSLSRFVEAESMPARAATAWCSPCSRTAG